MSEEEFSVEPGRTTKITYTVQRDWCDVMPISHGAARMHRILRSMMIETKDATPKPTRALTMDRMCWLMSSFQSKPVGEQTIRDYRKELLDNGMIDVLPGRSKNDPPRYVVHDLPPNDWTGWRNGWHVDDAYHSDWRIHRPQPSDTESKNGQFAPRPVGGWESNRGNLPHGSPDPTAHRGVPHGTPGGNPGTPGGKRGLTSDDGTPKEVFKEVVKESSSSSSSSLPRPSSAGAEDDEEERTSPPAVRPPAGRHPDTDSVINGTQWPTGSEPRGRDLAKIRNSVSGVLKKGWTKERLTTHLIARMRWNEAHDYTAVCLWVLSECLKDASQGHSAQEEALESLVAEIEAQKAAIGSCDGCDLVGKGPQGWHGHGRPGLDNELWVLQNPEQAAFNETMNAKKHRAG